MSHLPLERSGSLTGSLTRACARMIWLVGWTEALKAALRAHVRLRGEHPMTRLHYGQRWARGAVRSLGVEVDCLGAPPVGRVLIVANHRSYMDIPVILSQLPCTFLAKAEIGGWPVFGGAARLLRAVFVHRTVPESRHAARLATGQLLARGLSVATFPEGTTTPGPGMGDFAYGLFSLAEKNGFPVVPVAISYVDPEDAWVDDDSFVGHFLRRFRRRRLHVRLAFGPTLHADLDSDLREAAQGWIRAQLAELDRTA